MTPVRGPGTRVVVTRAQPGAGRWVQELGARGIVALAMPLVCIEPLGDTQALMQVWDRLGQFRAVMFVSRAAADHFFATRATGPALAALAQGLRLWATGPGTVQALLGHGMPLLAIDAPSPDSVQFDSEALWSAVHRTVNPGDRVLIVRGDDGRAGDGVTTGAEGSGRNWLASTLCGAGVQVQRVAVYRRRAPVWNAAQQGLARAAAVDNSVWLFTSSQAIAHLLAACPGQDWSRARAITTHPRIARSARDAGFGVVRESHPGLEELVGSIESFA